MQAMYYIGLDVHKRTISYCVKDGSGAIDSKGMGLVGNVADFSRFIEAGPESAWIENLETSW
jgi:hypothetical protein